MSFPDKTTDIQVENTGSSSTAVYSEQCFDISAGSKGTLPSAGQTNGSIPIVYTRRIMDKNMER